MRTTRAGVVAYCVFAGIIGGGSVGVMVYSHPDAPMPTVRTSSYWDGFQRGTSPFPLLTPPMTASEVYASCLVLAKAVNSEMSKPDHKAFVEGCREAGMEVQERNGGR